MQPAVYIMASARNGTLYVGVTSDLVRRVWQHRTDAIDGFTRRFGVHILVYFEMHGRIGDAIRREKDLKHWTRAWKIDLIERANPYWRDLWVDIAPGDDTGPPRTRG